MATITAANATIMLAITGLYPVPQHIQGFSADDIFDIEAITPAETQMGVDGKLSAGFVYVPVPWSVSLQADSASNAFFDAWYAAQQATKDVYFASGVVILNGINTKWAMINGVLTSYPPMPAAGKVLKPRKFQITWESVSPAVP